MRTLRVLFMISYGLLIINFFVPNIPAEVGFSTRYIAEYDVMKYQFQINQLSAYLLLLKLCFFVTIFILALVYPKRWVFIIGAIFATFALLILLIGPLSLILKELDLDWRPSVGYIVGGISCFLALTGFFIKPSKKTEAEKPEEIQKEKVVDVKEEAALREEYKEHKKKVDDDFLKY